MNSRFLIGAVLVALAVLAVVSWRAGKIEVDLPWRTGSGQTNQAFLSGNRDASFKVGKASGGRLVVAGRVDVFAEDRLVIALEQTGRLLALPVAEQGAVKQGEEIVIVDDAALRAQWAEAKARVVESEARVELAKATLDPLETGELEGVASGGEVALARRRLEWHQARQEAATARVARLQEALDATRVLAPMDGIVVARHARPGAVLAAGAPVLTLMRMDRRRVLAEVPEGETSRVQRGQPVKIALPGRTDAFWHGVVQGVPDILEPVNGSIGDRLQPGQPHVLRVPVEVKEELPLKPGTAVELTFLPF